MHIRHLLSCPDVNLRQKERVEALEDTVEEWLCSDAFVEVVRLFGGTVVRTGCIKERIAYYNSFAEVWDYRRKKAGGGERWLIQEDSFLADNRDVIMEYMYLLGLRDVVEPSQEPNFILPLGGARMANLDRCITAREVCTMYYPRRVIPIVALTGMRPINEIERTSLNLYAPNAQTEYEAMCGGISKAFDLSSEIYEEEFHDADNVNLSWAERRYHSKENRIFVLSAPSSDPARRANSMDTFEFFLTHYQLEPASRILLITSCIYVPFQLMKFTNLALKKDLFVECIGCKAKPGTESVLNAASYLQELKAAINAIYELSERYF